MDLQNELQNHFMEEYEELKKTYDEKLKEEIDSYRVLFYFLSNDFLNHVKNVLESWSHYEEEKIVSYILYCMRRLSFV
jgi:hypothetical protein